MKEYSACTTVLVGKKASIDGSTMIARNDDTFSPITRRDSLLNRLLRVKRDVRLSHG